MPKEMSFQLLLECICSKCTLNQYFSNFLYSNQHGHGQIWMLYANVHYILPKVLGRPLLMNRFDYFSNFYEYKS